MTDKTITVSGTAKENLEEIAEKEFESDFEEALLHLTVEFAAQKEGYHVSLSGQIESDS